MDISSINDWLNTRTAAPRTSQQVSGSARGDESTRRAEGVEDKVQPVAVAQSGARGIREAVENIQEFVQSVRRDLNFSLDDSSGKVIVKVTDTHSGDVIRQIPSEEALELAERLSEARSLLFTAQV